MDKVEFFLDGNSFPDIKSYTIKYDTFQSAGSFVASVNPDLLIPLGARPVTYRWDVNGITIQNGYVDKVEKSYSKGVQTLNISGRDYAQLVIDNYIQTPKPYVNKKLDDILTSIIIDNTSIDIKSFKSDRILLTNTKSLTGPPSLGIALSYSPACIQTVINQGFIEEYRTEYGQTIHDALVGLLKQFNLIIYNPPGSEGLLVHRINDTLTADSASAPSYNIAGEIVNDQPFPIVNKKENNVHNNVIDCSWTNDITSFCNWIKLIVTSSTEKNTSTVNQETLLAETVQQQMKYGVYVGENSGFSGLTKYKSVNLTESSFNVFEKNKETIINSILCEQYRNMYKLEYTVSNHSPAGGYPYFANHLACVTDDELQMTNQQWMIYGIEFTGSKEDGMKTKMELGWPAAGNGYVQGVLNKVKIGTRAAKPPAVSAPVL